MDENGETKNIRKANYERLSKIVEILDKTKWAKDFSYKQICKISPYITPVRAKKGKIVFTEGGSDIGIGIIVKGSIDIFKSSGNKINRVASLKNNQTFGEMALIDGESRSATGVAAETTLIFFLTKASLKTLFKDDHELGFQLLWKIAKTLSQRLRNTTGRLVDYLGR